MKPGSKEISDHLTYFNKHACGAAPFCLQIASPNPGDHVVIVAGTHGNEPGGVKAVIELHRALLSGDIALKRGKITFLLGNPEAYKKDVRYITEDLNRAFAGQNTSTVEGKRAREIKAFLDSNEDISTLLDLHSVSIGDFKLLVYSNAGFDNSAFAMKLSTIPLHFVFHPEHMPGTLIEAAGRQRIRSLIVECGNHYSRQAVNTARQHIYNFLAHHKLIDGDYMLKTEPPASITLYESIQAIKPHAGFKFLVEDIKTGTKLSKGCKYARDDHGYHIAPQDCHVVVPSLVVKSSDYDAGFLGKRTMIEGPELTYCC